MRYVLALISALVAGLLTICLATCLAFRAIFALAEDASVFMYAIIGHGLPIFLGVVAGLHSYRATAAKTIPKNSSDSTGWRKVIVIALAIALILTPSCIYVEYHIMEGVFLSRTANE